MKFEVETCESTIYNKPTQSRISKEQRLSQELCDNCNGRFEDSGHGVRFNEKIENVYTGRLICQKCYGKIYNAKPTSFNSRKKEFNKLVGRSKKRTETLCAKCKVELDNNPWPSFEAV